MSVCEAERLPGQPSHLQGGVCWRFNFFVFARMKVIAFHTMWKRCCVSATLRVSGNAITFPITLYVLSIFLAVTTFMMFA